ncbi:hypothetical protein [Paracoccus aminophilus]|uniref:Lipoprotein n=1 Tax=Paracoccus aminophilus JCM 7686 TaxID=1367847 RepID=S5YTH7_PARAH|nr:hypothetical protein [Paracoccus aminophilus]AGT08526.1 hypothetical protein JCM7686_1425 [Paracoccus aminophilus JCM 7686]
MKSLLALPALLILAACGEPQPQMTALDHDREDCARLEGRLEVQPDEVYCHLPNGEVLDEVDLILE